MKHKRDWFFAIIIIILVTILFCQYITKPKVNTVVADSIVDSLVGVKDEADIQKDATQQAIDEAINKAILGESIKEETSITAPETENNPIVSDTEIVSKPESTDNPISSIAGAIKDTLNNVNSDTDSGSAVKIVEVESSNKLTIEQDGVQIKIRLIGVHATGSKEGLKSLLLSTEDLMIETDTKKNEGEYKLVYLWNGEPNENGSNMINIQMIVNEYAYSTYDFVHPGVIENPNIKYQQYFINAIKK